MAEVGPSYRQPRRGFSVSVTTDAPDTLVWTWLALIGWGGAVTLAIAGVPSVDLHGPLHYAGIMDPFCGATRSVYLTMRGQWDAALRYNPTGPVLLIAAAVSVLRGVAWWVAGRWVQLRVSPRSMFTLVVLAGVALQVRQQLNVELLTSPWTGP